MRRIGSYLGAVALLLLATADAQTPDSTPGCVYNATPPSLSDKQQSAWQCDSSGHLLTTLPASAGTVKSVSVVTANGLSGTVATATTTPAITLLVGAINLSSATGLPISTGVSGLGTGVATALGVNVGSAGAPVLLNGALGTPSSGTLTSATGLPISTGVSGLGTGVATLLGGNSSGTGGPAGTTSPTFTTPVLGVATATSLNGVTVDNTAWTAYTPTATCGQATGTITCTATGRYKLLGKSIIGLEITITVSGTFTGGTVSSVTSPVAIGSAIYMIAGAETQTTGLGWYGVANIGTNINVVSVTNSNAVVTGAIVRLCFGIETN